MSGERSTGISKAKLPTVLSFRQRQVMWHFVQICSPDAGENDPIVSSTTATKITLVWKIGILFPVLFPYIQLYHSILGQRNRFEQQQRWL